MTGPLLQKKPIGALQDPAYGGSLSQALPDAQFYKDVGSRLYDLVVGGVQDVFATPARWSDPNWSLRGMEAQAWQNNPAGELNRVMAGPMGLAPLGATVYHGSPHKFSQFDASKIGTGEGAQAYGHGLYMAENPAVANEYVLAGKGPLALEGFDATAYGIPKRDAERLAGNWMKYKQVNPSEMHLYKVQNPKTGEDRLLNDVIAGKIKLAEGGVYKADLPDEMIPKMLDWDKPLSQQPAAVRNVLRESGMTRDVDKINTPAGEYFRTSGGIDAAFSQELQKLGIPGIRYLDQGSRTSGKGTYNYVVFPGEEKQLKILSRE